MTIVTHRPRRSKLFLMENKRPVYVRSREELRYNRFVVNMFVVINMYMYICIYILKKRTNNWNTRRREGM